MSRDPPKQRATFDRRRTELKVRSRKQTLQDWTINSVEDHLMEMEVWSGLPLSEAGESFRKSMRHSSEKANEKAEKKNSGTM